MGKSFLLKNIGEEVRERQNRKATSRSTSAINSARIFNVHTLTFNAWEYSANDSIWPGLVRKVMNLLEKEVRWPFPGRFLVKFGWNLKRLLRQERGRISLVIYLSAMAVACIIYALGTSHDLSEILAGLLAVGTLGGLLKLVTDTLTNPVSQWISDTLQKSEYGQQIGHFARIRRDLEFLEHQLRKANGRILILIDDLDRCEPDKAVEMLKAINLLLDFEAFIIFLGVDARMITRAIERHYVGLLGEAGASGYEYLDKIVQIPFRIPNPENHEVEAFLSEILGNPAPPVPSISTSTSEVDVQDVLTSPGVLSRSVAEAPYVLPLGAESNEELSGFTYDELQVFRNLAPFLKPNPRHLKRLVNIYRLIRTLIGRRWSQKPGPIICWVVLCAQWPYTAYLMLQDFEAILKKMNPGDDFPEESSLPSLLARVLEIGDSRLRGLLDYDPILLSRLVNEAEEAKDLLARPAEHSSVHDQLQSGSRM